MLCCEFWDEWERLWPMEDSSDGGIWGSLLVRLALDHGSTGIERRHGCGKWVGMSGDDERFVGGIWDCDQCGNEWGR